MFGNTEAGELCLDAGADVNALNDYRNTPLHNASLHDQVAFQVFLLSRDADLTITNMSGQSSMYLAMLHCQPDSTRLLVVAGAKLTGKEVKMYEQYVSVRNSLYTSFHAWSTELTRSCPLSLRTLCRISIRKRIKSPLLSNVTRLGLPSVLADYLLFTDFTTT